MLLFFHIFLYYLLYKTKILLTATNAKQAGVQRKIGKLTDEVPLSRTVGGLS